MRAQTSRERTARDANWLVSRMEATEWHSAYPTWKAEHASIPCRVFHGDGSALFILDLWAYRCTSVAAWGRASDFFYILNPGPAPESHLDQFQGEIIQSRAMPISVMQAIHDRIETLLTEKYGKPDEPESVPAAVSAWGSEDWRLLRVWSLPDRYIVLYLRNTPGMPVSVGLLARERALVLASTSEGTDLLINQQPGAGFEDQIDSTLASNLETDLPKVAALLSDTGARPRPATVFDAIEKTINLSISQLPDQHAELLLAADRLVARLHLPATAELPRGFKDALAALKSTPGMHFDWDPVSETWIYHHDLLWSIWKGAPQSEWGQDAFFLLLEHGWDTSGVCRAGSDQFRTVIRQGEKFLQEFPASPAVRPVMFLMAQANETWWSLSQWASCSPVTDPGLTPCAPAPASASYRKGAAQARESAISEYKALIGADPATYGTPQVRRSLARLELGIDTNQRRFYCLYN